MRRQAIGEALVGGQECAAGTGRQCDVNAIVSRATKAGGDREWVFPKVLRWHNRRSKRGEIFDCVGSCVWRHSPGASRFPQNVDHLGPKKIGHDQLQRSERKLLAYGERLRYQAFAVGRQHPFGGNAGVQDVGAQRSRSSRTISSAVGNGPGDGDGRKRILSRRSNISRRRANSSGVGMFCSSSSRISAAMDRRLFWARVRNASYKLSGTFST